MLDGDKNNGEPFKAQKENRESCWGMGRCKFNRKILID